jgi:hypothetical protein
MELRPSLLKRITSYADGLFMGFPLSEDNKALLDLTMAAAGRSADELEIAGWLVPSFPDGGPADFDATLDAQLHTLVSQGCDLIAIKPSNFIDDPNGMAAFCRHVLRRIDGMF